MERSRECAFWIWYIHVSSELNSFANRLSSSRYVDPPSFNVQLTAGTHHPDSVPGSVPEKRLVTGHAHPSRFHSKRKLAVTIFICARTQWSKTIETSEYSPRAKRGEYDLPRTYIRISLYGMRKIGILAAQVPKNIYIFFKSILGTTTFFARPSGDFRYNNRFFFSPFGRF